MDWDLGVFLAFNSLKSPKKLY
jgi:hypothetical protein